MTLRNLRLFEGPSGPEFLGSADGDVLTWDESAQAWKSQPGGGGAVDSVFGRTGDVVAAQDDYTAEQLDWTALNNGSVVMIINGTVLGLGSEIANVTGTGSRDPGTDKVCTVIAEDAGAAAKTLTITDATGKAAGFTFSVFVQQSSGAGRWSFATSTPTTLFTQPDAGAYALDFVWNGTSWGTPAWKPLKDFTLP